MDSNMLLSDELCAFGQDEIGLLIKTSAIFSNLLSYFIMIVVCAFLFTCFKTPFLVCVSILINEIINVIFKNLIRFPRPVDSCLDSYGFPSGHAQCSSMLCTLLILNYYDKYKGKKTGVFIRGFGWFSFCCVLTTIMICISRFVLRQHTVIQIIGGVVLGVIVGCVLSRVFRKCSSSK